MVVSDATLIENKIHLIFCEAFAGWINFEKGKITLNRLESVIAVSKLKIFEVFKRYVWSLSLRRHWLLKVNSHSKRFFKSFQLIHHLFITR